jgi:hypothetical protein
MRQREKENVVEKKLAKNKKLWTKFKQIVGKIFIYNRKERIF